MEVENRSVRIITLKVVEKVSEMKAVTVKSEPFGDAYNFSTSHELAKTAEVADDDQESGAGDASAKQTDVSVE